MYKTILTSLISGLALVVASCGKDPGPPPLLYAPGNRVLVVCEGMLGNGNSALTLHIPDSNRTAEDVFVNANHLNLGDVFQSITRIGEQYFLCINNSDKILVLQRDDFQLVGAIPVPKPRYILPVSETKAYVSTLFSDQVYIINPKTRSVTGTITMPFRNPEGMLRVGNQVLVATWDTAASAVYPIDIATDAVGAGVALAGRAPQEILQDKEGKVWVLSGNESKGVESKLSRLDPVTGAILKTFAFGAADPLKPVFNKTKDTLYFIEVSYSGGVANNGIYRMGIHDAALPTQAFIAASGFQYFWGIDMDPQTGLIYVADPVGFTQRGKVTVYRQDGSLLNSFGTGVGPGHFLFD